MTSITGKDPGEHFAEIAAEFGTPFYTRSDEAGTPQQKAILKKLSPQSVSASTLAGEPILAKLTRRRGTMLQSEVLK